MSRNSDPSSLHVITENGEQCFVWRHNQLTYIAQDKQELPLVFGLKFGNIAIKLDLSYNTLTSYANINLFTNLNELILDNNCLEDDHLDFKQNLRLKILSLNKNKLTDLYRLISTIKICFPNLEFLSLIGNPLCPSPILPNLVKKQPQVEFGGINEESRKSNKGRRQVFFADEQPIAGSAREDMALNGSALAKTAIQLLIDDEFTEFASQKYRYFIIYHLPNLRFLDSSPISDQERDEALKRCYWMESSTLGANETENHHHHQQVASSASQVCVQNGNHANDNHPNGTTVQPENPPACGQQPAEGSQLEGAQQAPFNNSLIGEQLQLEPRGAFSRLSYKYTGKNSEGNRFIRNNDL